jgi:hypothetical protein
MESSVSKMAIWRTTCPYSSQLPPMTLRTASLSLSNGLGACIHPIGKCCLCGCWLRLDNLSAGQRQLIALAPAERTPGAGRRLRLACRQPSSAKRSTRRRALRRLIHAFGHV